jgi:UDP-N-acetyl-D-mannosaminuronate dehydrogenase
MRGAPRRPLFHRILARIAMIGGGYVGLVSGACFAEFGSEVAVVEVDPGSGRMPIYEPGLDQLVAENVQAGRLLFTYGRSLCCPGRRRGGVHCCRNARPTRRWPR